MKKLSISILAILIFVLIIMGVMYFSERKQDETLTSENENSPQDEKVNIQDSFDQKIIYTTDTGQEEEKYKDHCAQLGGIFNTCGNPCAPNADMCASVCAYTCEKIPQEDDDKNTRAQYKDFRYGISLSYPKAIWSSKKSIALSNTTFINIYKENEISSEDLPIDHFSNVNHISFYPNGIPTEGVRAQTRDFDLEISSISSEKSTLYVLEDGTPFAAMLKPENLPESWGQSGFIWMRVAINDLETKCMRGEEKIDLDNCDPPMTDGKIVKSGTVDEKTWQEEIDILNSLQFLQNNKDDLIYIETPLNGSQITSPLEISGEARGSWFFEGTFPIVLTDWDGKIIAESSASTDSNWMTEEYVSFTAILKFDSPYTKEDPNFMKNGNLILQKANPSDLPGNSNVLEIKVEYRPKASEEKS